MSESSSDEQSPFPAVEHEYLEDLGNPLADQVAASLDDAVADQKALDDQRAQHIQERVQRLEDKDVPSDKRPI